MKRTLLRSAAADTDGTAFVPLKAALTDGTRSTAVQVLGDSTSDGTTDWVYRFAQSIAADYPTWTVQHRLWSDTTQDYAAPTTLQTGTAGARYLDMVNGYYPRRLHNAAAPHLTETIDARLDLYAADWTPPVPAFGSVILLSEGGGTGSWGWYLAINSIGVLKFGYSQDGSTLGEMAANAVTGITDGTRSWVRAVFIPNDGAGNRVCKFYKSTDGLTWTQIGTTVTTAGTVVLSDRIAAGSSYFLGSAGGTAGNTTAFRIHEVDIRNGDAGPGIVPRLPDLWSAFGAGNTHPIVGAPVLTIVNGSHSGATISYLDNATRRPRITPDFGQLVTFLSSSHNETSKTGRAWRAAYAAWVANVVQLGTEIVAVTQNPETSAALYSKEHAQRRFDLLAFAGALGIDVIDTYRAFLNAGWPGALMADDVHPNTAGSDLWRGTVKAVFDAAA